MALHAVAKHWVYCYHHYISLSYDFSIRKQWIFLNVTSYSLGKEWATYFLNLVYWLVLAENELKNHFINLTHGCLCSYRVDGHAKEMLLFWFLLWYNMWCHYFAVATGTTISSSLGRQYGTVDSQSFLDVYEKDTNNLSMIISVCIESECKIKQWNRLCK